MQNHWIFNPLPGNNPINLNHTITMQREEEQALGDRTYSIKFQAYTDGLRLVWNFPNAEMRDKVWYNILSELKVRVDATHPSFITAKAPDPAAAIASIKKESQPVAKKQPVRKSRKRKVEA